MLNTLMIIASLMSRPVTEPTPPPVFSISSPAFANGATIPTVYTCRGKDISMPLEWSGLPRGTKSLALIIVDPDVPRIAWYHWAVYNISPSVNGFKKKAQLPTNTIVVANSWGNKKYQGPCPPSGEHRYFIKLYALNIMLPTTNISTIPQLREAMRSHIIDTTQTMGRSSAN